MYLKASCLFWQYHITLMVPVILATCLTSHLTNFRFLFWCLSSYYPARAMIWEIWWLREKSTINFMQERNFMNHKQPASGVPRRYDLSQIMLRVEMVSSTMIMIGVISSKLSDLRAWLDIGLCFSSHERIVQEKQKR